MRPAGKDATLLSKAHKPFQHWEAFILGWQVDHCRLIRIELSQNAEAGLRDSLPLHVYPYF